mmetsp:Transcript_24093/g.66963  ORF Transcript_24093/g.66963 Transcript_24093/m.66963 type:complete len:201 (+) Transcript_24093:300-902(+)
MSLAPICSHTTILTSAAALVPAPLQGPLPPPWESIPACVALIVSRYCRLDATPGLGYRFNPPPRGPFGMGWEGSEGQGSQGKGSYSFSELTLVPTAGLAENRNSKRSAPLACLSNALQGHAHHRIVVISCCATRQNGGGARQPSRRRPRGPPRCRPDPPGSCRPPPGTLRSGLGWLSMGAVPLLRLAWPLSRPLEGCPPP